MATAKQQLGVFGEIVVARHCTCPRCKKGKSLKRLPPNFKCADVVCDFCVYLGQVKAKTVRNIETIPTKILGAAWGPQKERMEAGIFFPLFIVLVHEKEFSIYYLPADFQDPRMFVPRKPLSGKAKRAGWQGFYYDLSLLPVGALLRLH